MSGAQSNWEREIVQRQTIGAEKTGNRAKRRGEKRLGEEASERERERMRS